MSGNILREFKNFTDAKIVIEEGIDASSPAGKSLFMKGIFIQGDVRNHNQRVYPLREINRAICSLNERITQGHSILGECDHPEELSINLDRVSHMITEMWLNGNDGYGKLKILPTPMGNIIQTLLQSGAKLGVSSRGSGNVNEDGTVCDFDIVTIDIVAQPSAPDAYPRLIYESLFNMKGGHMIYETAEATTQDPNALKYLQKGIINFIKDLKI